MNLGQARIVVRERGAAEILDLSLRAPFVLGGALYLRLAAFTVLPCALACAVALWLDVHVAFIWTFAVVCFALIQGPFTLAASRLMFARQVTLREVLGQFSRNAVRYTFAQILKGLLYAGSTLLFVAAPVVWARLLFFAEVTLLEGTKIVPSYRRSIRLTQRRLGPALALWSALITITAAFVLAAHVLVDSISGDLLGLASATSLWRQGPTPLASIGLLCAAPFVATARFLAYIDCRTRREAWDVQVDFMRLALELTRTT